MSHTPYLIHDIAEAHTWLRQTQRSGRLVGLVPTMGALHEGHLALARASRDACGATVVTIFVNPTQFGPHEDLDRYPRMLEADLAKLADLQVDAVFAPQASDMYPHGFSTFVEPPEVANPLEGRLRPGHFRGVATVVLKLFQILPADVAFFGQKDYQQTLVVRHMVRDLNVPIEIRVCPTERDVDGLALSSRNAYLTPDQRQQATSIYRSLRLGEQLIRSGERDAERVRGAMREVLVAGGFQAERIEYVALADPESLRERNPLTLPTILLIAARLGLTRLIDNWIVT